MSSAQIKAILKEQIDAADDRLLKIIHVMIDAYQTTDTAFSYDVDGISKSAAQMREELEVEVESAKKGKYIRLDDLKTKSEKWMKRTK